MKNSSLHYRCVTVPSSVTDAAVHRAGKSFRGAIAKLALTGLGLSMAACGQSSASTPNSGASPSVDGAAQVTVTLSEWKVGTPTSIMAGKHNLAIPNSGQIEHELLVFKSTLAPNQYPLKGGGDIAEDGPGIAKVSDGENIAPGKSQTRTIELPTPGTYLFVCNLPGHFKMGMYAVVTATP